MLCFGQVFGGSCVFGWLDTKRMQPKAPTEATTIREIVVIFIAIPDPNIFRSVS